VLKTRFILSFFATPQGRHQEVFYTVPRAGHLMGGRDHHVKRNHFPGHELIYCIRGEGFVRVSGRIHAVKKGDLVWVNCQEPHEHGANAFNPWEVYWVRIEGPMLEKICRMLSVAEGPVFSESNGEKTVECYQEIFDLMRGESPDAPALIHAAVARLVAVVFCARLRNGEVVERVPFALRRPVEWMRLYYFQNITVSELAEMAGLSPGHFTRVFKNTFGTSPIDWLRRERISQAKRRLVGSQNPIKEIAEQVGYPDRFFFSKDFKKHTGLSPRQFRERESGAANR
jgi:AraC-like DNA-binding protein